MIGWFEAIGITDVRQLIVATMVFLMLPGPGTFCVLTCSAQRGMRGGYSALAGLMLGDAALMFLAAIGVAAMLQANPLMFRATQYLGAAYLGWLGLKLVFAKQEQGTTVVPFSHVADVRRGFLVTIINPKAIVFYMAFFPLFIDPVRQQGATTFVAMASVILCCTLFYGSVLVLAGNAAARRVAGSRRIKLFATRLAGFFLIAFGIKLTTN